MGKKIGKYSRVFWKVVLIAVIFSVTIGAFVVKMEASASADKADAYICMSADTGEIFDRKNEHLRLPMASTTKTMTALVILENCLPDEIVEIDQTAVRVEGSSIYLKRGEKFTVKELLFGLMLRSGNDAAVALAIHCAGSIESFAGMMNLKAEELGLIDTHFVNPHGLHDPEHYTSAYDLCKIGCEAMKNPMFREIVNTKFVTVGEGENKRYWSNKNKILTTFDGGNGIKTGFTKNAGRCLIASATREGKTVVSVVLNRYDMFSECRTMMEDAFSVIKSREKAVG